MVASHVTRLSGDAAADRVLCAYLADLSDRLILNRRSHTDVVAEIADGLSCAVEQRVLDGVPATEAAHAAVREFGAPAAVAATINRQQLAVTAHRLGFGLVATGPAVGLAWIVARTDGRLDWLDRVADMLSSAPFYPTVLVVTIPACLVAYAGAGFVARRIQIRTMLAATAATVATLMCMIGDLGLIGDVTINGARAGTPAGWTVVAIAASTVRVSVAAIGLRRLLRLRTAAA